MKHSIINRLFLVLFMVPLCLYGNVDRSYCKLARKIMNQHIKEMQAKEFRAIGSGGGFFYDVEHIELLFESDASPTIDEARRLFVPAVSRLLQTINSDPAIQPYLHNRPFTVKNLSYRISFNHKGAGLNDVRIAYVSLLCDKIYYSELCERKGKTFYNTAYAEHYEQALHLLNQAAALKCPNSQNQSLISSL